MTPLKQRIPVKRRFDFSSDAYAQPDTFAVVRMTGFEAISRPYRFELVLVSDDAQIDFERVLAADAHLSILAPDDQSRTTPYGGMLAEFTQLHQAGGYTFYRAVLVPRVWRLTLYRNSEVYLHEQSVPEIIERLLKEGQLRAGLDYELKLRAAYRPRSYVCQYQETPLDFISRWMEKEGIYYHFVQDQGRERLVLLDARDTQPPHRLPVVYRPADELDTGLAADSVQSFSCRTRPMPRRVVLQDFNYRRASVPLVARADVDVRGLGEELIYGENFRSVEEGEHYASVRAQEILCAARVFHAESTAVGPRSGALIGLQGHYRSEFNSDYLVTEITHEGSQAGALLAGLKTPWSQAEGEIAYRNSFVALDAARQYRPARSTPKPRVAGTLSATIDAEGSGEYAELDGFGQYRIQVPFDRTDKGASKGSAPVRMASPYAGSDHGMHFPLHKGAEVLLSFADGDPDQPVIVGAVPNSVNPSVIDQQNAHDNLISTKGGNQVLMKDTEGKQVIWLNSPFHKSSIGVGSVDPKGGGSIYEATEGGKDGVSFGVNNEMKFGSSNALSMGTETSLKASFGNSVSWGSEVAIKASNSIDWSMGMLGSLLKSVSIEDGESVELKDEFSHSVLEGAKLGAGALAGDLTTLALKTKLTRLKAIIAAYTAVNFAQSTVFGMAVNGSAGGALLTDHDSQRLKDDKAKKAQDEFAAEESLQKTKAAIDKASEDKKAKLDEEIKAQKAQAAEEKDPQKKADLEKEVAAKEKEREGLDFEAWEAKRKAEEASKKSLEGQHASANPDSNSLQGWPGIIGKFGLDALLNVTAMAAIQGYARSIAGDIEGVKLVSEMGLDDQGVRLIANGANAPANAGAVRNELTLSPQNGISIAAAVTGEFGQPDPTTATGQVQISAGALVLQTGGEAEVTAAKGRFSDRGQGTGFFFDQAASRAQLKSSGASLVVEGTDATLTGSKVSVGQAVDVDPARLVLVAQQQAAAALVQAAYSALSDIDRQTMTRRQKSLARQAAYASLTLAQQQMQAADTALLNHVVGVTVSVMNGLTVDAQQLLLRFQQSGLKVSPTGLAMNFGSSNLDLSPVGLSAQGQLIKLG